MSQLPAYAVHAAFPPEACKSIQFDRHYFLYAERGTMRLEADGRVWSLPPARAAWIAADAPITISIPTGITAASALFDPTQFAAPKASLSVIDMNDLARALIKACRPYGPDKPQSPYATSLFQTLAHLADDLAERPSATWLPLGQSAVVQRALQVTEAQLDGDLDFDTLAKTLAISPRALARKFAAELGLTWRAAQRRMRIIRAMELLAEDRDLQVTQAALDVGYTSLSAFNAAFRDQTCQTPSAFRASLSGGDTA